MLRKWPRSNRPDNRLERGALKSGTLYLIAILSVLLVMPGFAEQSAPVDTVRAVIGADGKQRAQILGGSYFFKPKHIIVKVNVPVALSITRESGIVPHTFVMKIPESGIMLDESLDTEARTVEFTPTVVGRYKFYCGNKLLFFKSHEEKGMKGVFEVVP